MKNHLGQKMGFRAFLFGVMVLVPVLWSGAVLAAAGSGDSTIPESLKPWKGWALHGQEAWLCPSVSGQHDRSFCAWPGELKLEAARQGDGMKFLQNWELQYESAVPLPGNRKYWPQQVAVDGRAHPVLLRGDTPVVWLTKGRHAVSGWISWQERPQAMDIPENVALVSLVIDGKPVLPLARHGKALMLGAQEDAVTRAEDSLDIQVFRKLSDGIPARLTTRFLLKVSGKAREWSVSNVLPAHFVPISISSPWAARLDTDGRLQVQVMPGQAVVEVEARLNKPLEDVEPIFSPERQQEVWSYEATPVLRVTAVSPNESMLNVDPRQAGVPAGWLSLPAFVVNPKARFQIEERSRGQNEREGQRLVLKRDMWLDFSGKGFFARDRIEGSMRQGWRFDVAKPYRLERADSLMARREAPDDLSAALLVTVGADETLTGVEWHQMNVTLNAGVRLEADVSSRVPVTGWQQSFDSVETTLRMPYGYRLIAAPGVDRASGNVWVERWTILDVFLAAFFALLAWRMFGTVGGVISIAYLTLGMHESAPVQPFAAVIILALLCRALPEGRLRKVLRAGERIALLCFVGAAVLFIPTQIRTALYPQLEGGGMVEAVLVDMPADMPDEQDSAVDRMERIAELGAVSPASPPPPESLSIKSSQEAVMRSQGAVVMSKEAEKPATLRRGMSAYAPEQRQRYAQSTVTQTGGGEPAWTLGHSYRLHWSGPVTEAQSVRLLLSPPWLTRLLRLLIVALLGWLVWRSVRMVFPGAGAPSSWGKPGAAKASTPSATAALFILCLAGFVAVGLGFSTPTAAAPPESSAFPPDDLLEELRTRLLKAPACSPSCVDIAKVRIDADASQFKVMLVAHVEAVTSLPLPVPDEQMTLRGARVNGEAQPVLRVGEQNYIALPRGVHHVQLEYALDDDSASLGFPIRPAQIEFGSAYWQADGIDEGRLLGETLNFSRVAAATAAPSTDRKGGGDAAMALSSSAQQFPPFVHVQRDLIFDLDWSVRTQVRRIAPEDGGFTFPVPLLPGEHITTPELKVQDGRALAVFASKTNTANWTARLDKVKNVIELRAPLLTEHAETWRVTVNPSWHLEWEGVPVTLKSSGEDVMFVFHPLPGEKLVLTLTQPVKTEGGIRAIDSVRLENHVGQHASDVTLEFNLRASQGGEHLITLPSELEVLEVRRGGVPLNLQARENRLSLPVSPGSQTYTLRLRHQGEVGFFMSSPGIALGLPAANINLRVVLGKQRWILATSGPVVGPAVLYWGELLAALLLAFLLAKSGISSLKRWQWFLLVLGFSTFSWMTLFVITLWLLVIDWRVRRESCSDWPARRFNAMQVGIVILTAMMLYKLINTVPEGLLGVPDMGIRGYGSGNNNLAWFADQSDSLLPVATVFSLPIWLYRALMLAWTLWLANILIRWLSRGFSAWLKNGYWKKTGRMWKKKTVPQPIASETATGDEKCDQNGEEGGK
ncbi:MAG: hypothetical protein FWG26_06395 [Betaproteobacteria bacterium]|nr:hypothetical protein [Betaproteobacteria bacterium]